MYLSVEFYFVMDTLDTLLSNFAKRTHLSISIAI